jgi:hypothetical protein
MVGTMREPLRGTTERVTHAKLIKIRQERRILSCACHETWTDISLALLAQIEYFPDRIGHPVPMPNSIQTVLYSDV